VVFAKYFFCLGKKWRKNRPLIASPRMEAASWANAYRYAVLNSDKGKLLLSAYKCITPYNCKDRIR